jgi:uncharacterized membrane protein YqjE
VSETQFDQEPSREMSFGDLLQRLTEQAAALGEARIQMARTELAQDLSGQVRRVAVFAAAAVLVVFGLQFLVVAAVLALATQIGAWLASLLVSVLCLFAGTTTLLIARSRAGTPFLKRTREAPGEDLRWLSTLVR